MPDSMGYRPNYKALLIVPEVTMQHIDHSPICIQSAWAIVGRTLFAAKHAIDILQVKIASTTGLRAEDFSLYAGKTCVLATRAGMVPLSVEMIDEAQKTARYQVIQYGSENSKIIIGDGIEYTNTVIRRDVPKAADWFIYEPRNFEVAFVVNEGEMMLSPVDVAGSCEHYLAISRPTYKFSKATYSVEQI